MILEAKHLKYGYNNEPDTFTGISFSLVKGEVFCILGPNGTGKSTLLNCLGRLFHLRSGDILVNNKSINSMGQKEFARYVGYVPQFHVPVFPYRVKEFVLLGRTPHIGTISMPGKEDHRIANKAIGELGIEHLADKPYTEISDGERQLVMFARALAQQPEFILLDEPTTHLDFGNQERILKLIKRLSKAGYGIVMTSHFPDHALTYAQKVGIMKGGKFISTGEPQHAVSEDTLEKAYGIKVKMVNLRELNRSVCLAVEEI